jgi:hypothetical protein
MRPAKDVQKIPSTNGKMGKKDQRLEPSLISTSETFPGAYIAQA